MTRTLSTILGAALISTTAILGFAEAASAQQMGRTPWSFSARAPSLAAQFYFQREESAAQRAMGVLDQYVTNYNSSSTSVGNLNEITQILSGGSTGSLSTDSVQDSTGDQGSAADTGVTSTNTTTVNGTQTLN